MIKLPTYGGCSVRESGRLDTTEILFRGRTLIVFKVHLYPLTDLDNQILSNTTSAKIKIVFVKQIQTEHLTTNNLSCYVC